jgi:predicted metal-dependent phosphoesterase TrpH
MFTVDLHTHTRFFHGFEGEPTRFDPIGANLSALYGQWRGLDGLALTNHDYYADFEVIPERLQFIPGVEITTTQGHALVVGPDPPTRTAPGELTPQEVVTLAHNAGCAAIIAHPYRRSSIRKSGADFDAVEINGKHPGNIDQIQKLADSLDLPIVGGSDAHFPFEVGRVFTTIDADVLTPESVVAAIRAEQVEPYVRDDFLNRTIQTGYRYVHKYLQ